LLDWNFAQHLKARREKEKMKIAFIGGHMSPALAVIKVLPADAKSIFIGRMYALEGDKATSLEYKTLREIGIPFYPITTGRLQRKFTRHTFSSLIKIPIGIVQALAILRKEKPDIVLAFGGYLAFPVSLAAYILNVPIVIHEQTLAAGLTNKAIAPLASKICISWESSGRYFDKKKTILTGNPIRREIASETNTSKILEQIGEKEKVIYITGGSLGSHALNALITDCLEKLLENFTIVHQTGDASEFKDFERLQHRRAGFPVQLQNRYILTKFVDPKEVGSIVRRADLVISRSGVNTISELLYLKKPSLLIPLPHGQGNEQQRNASLLKEAGLAEVVSQSDLTAEKLYTSITHMMQHLDKYHVHDQYSFNYDFTNAAENIYRVIQDVVKKN
jgi:UDP-N-acetylglucosamine--N-acetylmuramyl-(pentapeptide) pyrophosphoryl-undecaprenol N-acetylglucosamine transferase